MTSNVNERDDVIAAHHFLIKGMGEDGGGAQTCVDQVAFCSLSSTVCLLFFRERGATHSLPFLSTDVSGACDLSPAHTHSHRADHRCLVEGKGDDTQTD